MSHKRFLLTATSICFSITMLTACPDPCNQLGEGLCTCRAQGDRNEYEKCIKEVKIWLDKTTGDKDRREKACIDAFNTCTCEKFEARQYDECGMTRLGDGD